MNLKFRKTMMKRVASALGLFQAIAISLSEPASGLFNIVCHTNLRQVTSPSPTRGNQKASALVAFRAICSSLFNWKDEREARVSPTMPPQEPGPDPRAPAWKTERFFNKTKAHLPGSPLSSLFLCLTFILLSVFYFILFLGAGKKISERLGFEKITDQTNKRLSAWQLLT